MVFDNMALSHVGGWGGRKIPFLIVSRFGLPAVNYSRVREMSPSSRPFSLACSNLSRVYQSIFDEQYTMF